MELDKKTIEEIIRQVIREEAGKAAPERRQTDPSGVICADPRDAALEPFPFGAPAGRVAVKDLFTTEESPRLGAGVMELERASLDWKLAYDEIDYVIEGELEIVIEGRKVRAEAGQAAYIPKGTAITFRAPGKARFLYVVYPANWADLA
jgi:ethanolamine utilization protein EutQ